MIARLGAGFAWAVAAAVFCSAAPAFARDPIETWLEAGVRYEPVDDLHLVLSQSVRWDDRFNEVEKLIPELGVTYRVLDWLRIGGGYRFTADRRAEGDFRFLHRLYGEARASQEVADRLELQWRTRLQAQFWQTPGGDRLREPTLRNRVSAEYEAGDYVAPFVKWEVFSPFGSSAADQSSPAKWRAGVGVTFELGHHQLEPFYHFEQSITAEPVERGHIIGLAYRYDI